MANPLSTYDTNKYLKYLIILCVCVNAVGLFFPILRNDDPTLYASIAKNILVSGDWLRLFHPLASDWLDKPHLQFWLTALSFKIFGINSFAYMLPGFLFNLVGGYYTYRLGRKLYAKTPALLAALIYLSAFHLLLSATIDVRAEAYLCGMIPAACYYLLKIFSQQKLSGKSLFLASFMVAAAIMTKGIFVVITIASGIVITIYYHVVYTKTLRLPQVIIRLMFVLILVSLFITPELFALYVQFDAHPEKVVFAHQHVSAIKWFLWDSQIGRFFNTGQITRHDGVSVAHYVFFIHTFLWSFLPWSLVFIVALVDIIKKRRYNYPSILLLSWFFITFIMFSLSKFQLDYYTNILVPFAAIISAVYLHDIYCAYFNHETESSVVSFPRRRESRIYKIYQRMCCNLVVQKVQRSTTNTTLAQHKLLYVQIYLFYLLALVFFALGLYVLSGVAQIVVVIMAIAVLGFSYWAAHKSQWLHAIIVGVVAIQSIFIILMLIYATIYSKYDLGYNVANYINRQQAQLNVVSYKLNSLTLEFYLKNNGYQQIDDMGKLKQLPGKFYVISSVENLAELKNYYGNRLKVLSDFDDMTIDKLSQHILQANKFATLSQQYLLMTIEN